jgi:hypothetical protein
MCDADSSDGQEVRALHQHGLDRRNQIRVNRKREEISLPNFLENLAAGVKCLRLVTQNHGKSWHPLGHKVKPRQLERTKSKG